MSIYLLENFAAKTVKTTKRLVVAAENEANAKAFAASHFNGDGTWADATATALVEATMDANASMLGYVWQIQIIGAAGQTVDPINVSVVGTGTDDLDAIAALLVIELNAATDIANAAYAAPNLTIASGAGGDDLGDATVTIQVYPPSGNTQENLATIFHGTITHEGAANAALTVALKADTVAMPEVLAEA